MSDREEKIHVRAMAAGDRAAVLGLFREFIRHESGLPPALSPFVEDRVTDPGKAEDYLLYCEENVREGGGALLVADCDGAVAGFLCWVTSADGVFVQEHLRRVGEVLFIMTSEHHRGRGIGSLLMQEAERLTKEAGLNRLSLMVMAGNSDAIALYEKLGYRARALKMLKKV